MATVSLQRFLWGPTLDGAFEDCLNIPQVCAVTLPVTPQCVASDKAVCNMFLQQPCGKSEHRTAQAARGLIKISDIQYIGN